MLLFLDLFGIMSIGEIYLSNSKSSKRVDCYIRNCVFDLSLFRLSYVDRVNTVFLRSQNNCGLRFTA